jgi:predicted NUDIX family NTP pyrophosphohydrolase
MKCGAILGNSLCPTGAGRKIDGKKMVHSAGTLLYRFRDGALQVLLVHPSGNYNRRAPWSIPKGIPDDGEALEAAARRETREETGVEAGELTEIGSIDYQRSRKRIFAFAGPAPQDAQPDCASWEVDGAEFVAIDEARRRIHPDQAPFLDRLEAMLKSESSAQEEMP